MSLEGVTVTLTAEPPDGVNETIKFAVRKPVPAKTKFDARELYMLPVTEVRTAGTADTLPNHFHHSFPELQGLY